MSGRVRKKFQMTSFIMPNNVFLIKQALKSVPGLADVGDPHGDEDGPQICGQMVGIKKVPPPC